MLLNNQRGSKINQKKKNPISRRIIEILNEIEKAEPIMPFNSFDLLFPIYSDILFLNPFPIPRLASIAHEINVRIVWKIPNRSFPRKLSARGTARKLKI